MGICGGKFAEPTSEGGAVEWVYRSKRDARIETLLFRLLTGITGLAILKYRGTSMKDHALSV